MVSKEDKAAAIEYKEAGNELFRRKKYMEAIAKYKKAAKHDPTSAVYWSNIAACQYNLRDWTKLKKAAEKCIELDNSFLKGYFRLAQAQRAMNEFEEAQETLQRALELNPRNKDILEMKAKNDIDIHQRNYMKTEILKMPESGYFEFFGGGNSEQVPSDSFYAQLPRPAVPPCARKLTKESASVGLDERVRCAIEYFCSKDLRVMWMATNDFLQVEGFLPDDDKPVMTVYCTDVHNPLPFGYRTDANQTYYRLLTYDHKEIFSLILLSRFLRTKGRNLAIKWSNVVYECLITQFEERMMFKDAFDSHLVYCGTY
jgi:tetratricopeptide (TPR) repeat protein